MTHVYDDVTYVYDDVTYVYDDVTYAPEIKVPSIVTLHSRCARLSRIFCLHVSLHVSLVDVPVH